MSGLCLFLFSACVGGNSSGSGKSSPESSRTDAGPQLDINKTIADDKKTTCASFNTKEDCENAGKSHGLVCEFKIVCLAKIYHQELKLDEAKIERDAQQNVSLYHSNHAFKNDEYKRLAKEDYKLFLIWSEINEKLKLKHEEALQIAKQKINASFNNNKLAMEALYDKAQAAKDARDAAARAEEERTNPKPDSATIKRRQEEAKAQEAKRLKEQRELKERLAAQAQAEEARKKAVLAKQKEDLAKIKLEEQQRLAAKKADRKAKAAHEQKIKNFITKLPLASSISSVDWLTVDDTLKTIDEMSETEFNQLQANIKKYDKFDLSALAKNLMKASKLNQKVVELFDAILESPNKAIYLFIEEIVDSTSKEGNSENLNFKKEIVSLILQKSPQEQEIFGYGTNKVSFNDVYKILNEEQYKLVLSKYLTDKASKDEIGNVWREIKDINISNDDNLLNLITALLTRADTLKLDISYMVKGFFSSSYYPYITSEKSVQDKFIKILNYLLLNSTEKNGIEKIFLNLGIHSTGEIDNDFIEQIRVISRNDGTFKQALIQFLQTKASAKLVTKLETFSAPTGSSTYLNDKQQFIKEILTASGK